MRSVPCTSEPQFEVQALFWFGMFHFWIEGKAGQFWGLIIWDSNCPRTDFIIGFDIYKQLKDQLRVKHKVEPSETSSSHIPQLQSYFQSLMKNMSES